MRSRNEVRSRHFALAASHFALHTTHFAMTGPTLRLSPRDLRAELERLILADLLGPAGGDHEELDEPRVSERYLVGLLAPRRFRPDAGESVEDDLAVAGASEGDEGAPEPVSPPIDQLVPSAIGLTFAVENTTETLKVIASWGAYKREASESGIETEAGNAKVVWRRNPAGGRTRDLKLDFGEIEPFAPDPDYPEVVIRGRVRERHGQRLVTLFLVNDQPEPEQRRDEAWLFQAELQVLGAGSVFVRRALPPVEANEIDSAERRGLDMRYRDQVELAVGHGTAVTVERDADDPARGHRIRTVVAPAYEVPLTEAPGPRDISALAAVTLDMTRLANAGHGELPGLLEPLADAYVAWIAEQERRIPTSPGMRKRHGPRWTTVARPPSASAPGSPRSPTQSWPRRSSSQTRRWPASACARSPPSATAPRAGTSSGWPTNSTSRRAVPGARSSSPSCCSTCPASRTSATRAQRRRRPRRPAVVPDRRRQDRGLSRADRVHARVAASAGRGRGPRRPRRCRRADALHAAPADAPAVPARDRARLRDGTDAPRARRRALGEHAVPDRPLGGAALDAEPHGGRRRVGEGPARPDARRGRRRIVAGAVRCAARGAARRSIPDGTSTSTRARRAGTPTRSTWCLRPT